jgi:hypothetical protein
MTNDISDLTEDEGIEDLDKTFLRVKNNFRTGNESASNFEYSPKEILDEYIRFDE